MAQDKILDKILFVDDEAGVLSAIRRAVADESFIPFFAGSGAEALALMEKTSFGVIVTDMRMPGMDGLALLRIVKEKYPKTVRVVLSGYTQLSQMLVTINQGEIFKFITKPWAGEEELLPAIRQAIGYYHLQIERDTLSDTLAAKNAAYQKIFREMEDKKKQERKELQNLYKISTLLFALFRKTITTDAETIAAQKAKQEEILRIAEIIYLTYVSQLPATTARSTPAELADKISSSCNQRVAIELEANGVQLLRGNHHYLAMIFKVLLHLLPKAEQDVPLLMTAVPQTEEAPAQLAFNLNLENILLSAHDQGSLKIACTLLNKTAAFYNMSVEMIDEDGQPASIQLKAMSEYQ